jgi:multidrug efflux pump subunit AcrA (membrane-fusion protein)
MRIPLPAIVRRHKKKSIVFAIILFLLFLWFLFGRGPDVPDYVTAAVKRGDVRQTVEAVGTVVSERDLELRFAGAGVVDQVYVKEGDRVNAGQRLAQLRAGSLGASISAQNAALQVEYANLRALEEGTRPEDIAIAEADLNSKKASLSVAKSTLTSSEEDLRQAEQQLATLQQETNVNLAGQVSTSLSALSENLVTAESSLSTVADTLSAVNVQDAIIKDRPGADNEVRAAENNARNLIASARSKAASASDYAGALVALQQARTAISSASSTMDMLFSLVNGLRETNNFTSATRETYKASIATERARVQDAASGVSTTVSNLQNASASYDTRISAQRASVASAQGSRDRANTDILTFDAAIRSSEAQLALKKAGARKTDIDGARARIRQAQANLARARADFSDTVLVAPVAGTVTQVHVKGGEYPPAGAAVQLLGDSPFRVEIFASEIDIPKVQMTQSGSIELDAFRDTHFRLHVGQVDRSATEKDGVPKYRIKLDFVYPHPELSIGMTGDAEITTGMRSNVLSVPLRAVLVNAEGKKIVRILQEDGTTEERPVTLGMEGGAGDVEVTDGVKEGETVVVLVKE